MSRVQEMVAATAGVPSVRRVLTTASRFAEWVAPDVTVVPLTRAETLGPGDRLRLTVVGGLAFDYLVEAVSDREVVFAFSGPWSGRERWSFVADGSETLIRRVYEVDEGSLAAELAWRTIGYWVVLAHFKLELARFRDAVERDPGPRNEIEQGSRGPAAPPGGSFPIDEADDGGAGPVRPGRAARDSRRALERTRAAVPALRRRDDRPPDRRRLVRPRLRATARLAHLPPVPPKRDLRRETGDEELK